jgi:hypothetical protein
VIFDKSPFTPPEEWVRPYHPLITINYPESKVEFVAYELPKSEQERPAMNEAWQREMVRLWEAQPPSKPVFQQAMRWREERRQIYSSGDKKMRAIRKRLMQKAAEQQATANQGSESTVTEEPRAGIKTNAAREERTQKEEYVFHIVAPLP